MSIPVLNYGGNAGIEDMSAFNARLVVNWKGDQLFRVYAADESLYFIRVGGGRTKNAAVGVQFGLLGALIVYFANKREKKKTQETLNQIAGASPSELLASHKLNFVIPLDQVKAAEILPKTFFGGAVSGSCRMVEAAGKKRHLLFDDTDNMRLAIEKLSHILGDRIKLSVRWDDSKQKYLKLK